MGVLQLHPPEGLPTILEQELTEVSLNPWSDTAWSVRAPWNWMEEGVELSIAYDDGNSVQSYHHTLTDLGAPHRFTVSRSKIVLFGESTFDTTTYSAQQIGLDFFSVLPISELHWVDSTNWVLDEIVIRGSSGPVKVNSESDRTEFTSDPDRWGILKNIFTHRLNLANTGLGLENTTFNGGNSPYSFGTTLGMGWVVNESGQYVDINNAPYSAGWTGWSSIWHGECGNIFNHEMGHSFTLLHFVEGTGNSWGIGDEYPSDGVNLETHPWGYDVIHDQFRTWYRVEDEGVVYQDDGTIQGKRDSMNGGESSNSVHCFPQYTNYHTWKIQHWMENTPTFGRIAGGADLVQWDSDAKQYQSATSSSELHVPTEVYAPVITIVGSLADIDIPEANHIYPPLFWDSGNLFPLPNPIQSGLTGFDGANYFVEITYVDGITEHALINQSNVQSTELNLFSFNLSLSNNPLQLRLLHSETGYPNIDIENATELYSRTVEIPVELPKAGTIGRQTLNVGHITLDSWCEEGVNCEIQGEQLLWADSEPLSFHHGIPSTEVCSEEDSFNTFDIEVRNETGDTAQIRVHGQRIVQSGERTWNVAMNDSTLWSAQANQRQQIHLWIPYSENQTLGSGTWYGSDRLEILSGSDQDASSIDTIGVDINLTIENVNSIILNSVYESPSLQTTDSSIYFVVTDSSIGPTNSEWWGSNTHTPLSIPMVDQETDEATIVTVHSYKQTCNLGWGTLWTLNSGQAADTDCTYQVRLEMPDSGNEHLESGHTYRSPASQPIIFEGRRWHGPNGGSLIGRFVLQMEYLAP